MTSRAMPRAIVPGLTVLLLLATCGCGREDDNVVIVESPEPDFTPSPGQVIITAKSSPTPKAKASVASAAPSASPGDGLVPFLTVITPLRTADGEFQPLVHIELDEGGVKAVEDNASPDGSGARGNFHKVKPGKYLMKVVSDQMPETPLEERQVTVDGLRSETITMGAVTIAIPTNREDDVMRAIHMSIVAEPSRKLMLRASLKEMTAHGVVGEAHPRTVLLPFGRYSYTLACTSTDPTLGFAGVPDGTPPIISANTFTLTDEHPVSQVNLQTIIRTKAQ